MESIETAKKVIRKSIEKGYKLPNITDFYIWFAGANYFDWVDIINITRKEWQEAKKQVFTNFTFR
jgi:hypothetical protein